MKYKSNKKISQLFLSNLECVIFDVDGCLVDVRKSYNTAIKKTVDFTRKYLVAIAALDNFRHTNLVSNDIILKFRQRGGFNNDIDTSYALCLAELANPHGEVSDAREFLYEIASNSDETGIISVEKFLASSTSSSFIGYLKKLLDYPAPAGKSVIATVFDELFYGPELFKKLHGFEPRYYFGKPLIENDKLVITRKTMDLLSRKFNGNLAIVSGRSELAAEYSLWPILDAFNQDACVFLEGERREYAKPNPYAVVKAMKNIGANTAIYTGDSFEDLIMVRRAEEKNHLRIVFCGVYGCSPRPRETIRQFKEKGADVIIHDINQLPKILNKVSVKE
ncbi:MAG TPA: HAD family hydrolase [Candidatus Bathyarchaeia archaeon]|nr:HAD family hydrolase [Candidatus Bathyarchaeia archaeon]